MLYTLGRRPFAPDNRCFAPLGVHGLFMGPSLSDEDEGHDSEIRSRRPRVRTTVRYTPVAYEPAAGHSTGVSRGAPLGHFQLFALLY